MQAGTDQCTNLLQQNPSVHMYYASMAAWSSLLITRKYHRVLLSYALLGCGSGILVLVLLFVLSLFLALFVSACHSATYLAIGLGTTF